MRPCRELDALTLVIQFGVSDEIFFSSFLTYDRDIADGEKYVDHGLAVRARQIQLRLILARLVVFWVSRSSVATDLRHTLTKADPEPPPADWGAAE